MKESTPQEPQAEKGDTREGIVNEMRRKFLKDIGIAGAITTSALAYPNAIDMGRKLYGETIDKENIENEIASLRERLRTERGVEVDFSEIFSEEEKKIDGATLKYLVEMRKVCEMLLREFAVYPPFVHKETGLSTIRVINNLTHTENGVTEDIRGLASTSRSVMYLQYENKISEGKNEDAKVSHMFKTLLPSIEGSVKEMVPIFHHEMEHFIDTIDADTWSKGTRGFGYGVETDGNGALYLYDDEFDSMEKNNIIKTSDSIKFRTSTKGFARKYGRFNFFEDRATIAEALYLSESAKVMRKRCETDSVLSKKIAYLKKTYFEESYGTMDEKYWNLIEKGEVEKETVAQYLKLRANMLIQLSDEAFVRYVEEGRGGVCTKEEMSEWRQKLVEWVREES